MRIAIAGASGFIGSALVKYLKEENHEAVSLTRHSEEKGVFWNQKNDQIDLAELEGIDVFINLCGESILGRWNQKKMERIRFSRIDTTHFFVEKLQQLKCPPELYVGASAVGIYGDRGDEALLENSHSGHGYLAEVCRDWERETLPLNKIMRVVHTRFGIVFGPKGGALPLMVKPFKLGLGGILGSGKQYVSWIALDDLTRGIDFIIHNKDITGNVNFVSPYPVTNKELTITLGKILNRPTPFPVPRWVLYLLFRSGAEIYLDSVKAFPKLLMDNGFVFTLPQLDQALKKYLLSKS